MLAFCEFSFGPDILLLLQIPQVEGPAVAVGHHGNHQGEGEEREAADRDVAEPRREVAGGLFGGCIFEKCIFSHFSKNAFSKNAFSKNAIKQPLQSEFVVKMLPFFCKML